MQKTSRPLTARERRDLGPALGMQKIKSDTFWYFQIPLLSLAGIPLGHLFSRPILASILISGGLYLSLLLAASLLMPLYRYLCSKMRTASERKRDADLAGGVADVFTYEATEVLRVAEKEDEGSHYFLHLADGSVLYLTGQYLYEYESRKRKKFPSTRFDIVVAPQSRLVLRIISRGEYLEPVKNLKPFRPELYQAGEVPDDLEIVSISWDEIEAKYS